MQRLSRAVAFCVALLTFASGALAQDGGDSRVIPPGQDELVASMLGASEMLDGCRLSAASVEPHEIVARYRCVGLSDDVVLVLRERLAATRAQAQASSERFDIIGHAGGPRAELVEALEARVRAREHGFRFVAPPAAQAHAHVPSDTDSARNAARAPSALRFALSAMLLVVLVTVLRGLGRRAPKAGAAAFGALFALVTGYLMRALGESVFTAAIGLRAESLTVLPWVLAGLLLESALVYLWRRRSRVRGDLYVCVGVAMLVVALAYGAALRSAGSELALKGMLGTVSTGQVPGGVVDGDPRRLRVFDRYNEHGLRGASWGERTTPDVVRTVVIGDSFVAGLGVRLEETLPVRLREALVDEGVARPVEVLNLGIPGNNLHSHVDVLRETYDRLEPDYVVLCLTLVNDLSPFDVQNSLMDAARPSVYSLATLLFGGRFAAWAIGSHRLARELDSDALQVLHQELPRIRALQARPDAVPLFVFTFGYRDERVLGTLRRIPRARVVAPVALREGYAIPGDGHPTATAHAAYAARMAEALVNDTETRARLGLSARHRH